MTHIIGKPPAPKGGATFGDVPATKGRDSLCLRRDGCLIARIEEHAAVNAPGVHVNAKHIPSGAEFWLDYDEPVTPLDITPRDPEPDPAVTTYGELEPGGIVESDGDLGIRTWEDGTSAAFLVDLESGEPWQPRNPVRRVSASVVVHEEPGTHVWPDDADSSRVAILEPESGRMSYDRAEAETIIRQLTAWLAQEPASSESVEPLNVDMGEGFLDPSEDAGWRPAECRETKSQCTQQCATICAKTGEDVEPPEDRSRPAPGYQLTPSDPRAAWREPGFTLWRDERVVLLNASEEDCIVASWAGHDAQQADDAQQAGKGGE